MTYLEKGDHFKCPAFSREGADAFVQAPELFSDLALA